MKTYKQLYAKKCSIVLMDECAAKTEATNRAVWSGWEKNVGEKIDDTLSLER